MSALRTEITAAHVAAVKAAVDMGALARSYGIELRQSGTDSLTGKCIFHKEKTGSLVIHPKAGYCHCFGCGVTFDCIGFIQRADGLSFPAAVRLLAEQYGVSLDGPRVDAATARRQREYARRLAAEAAWWWGTVVQRYHDRQAWLVATLTGYADRATDDGTLPAEIAEERYQYYARRAWRFVRAIRRVDAATPAEVAPRWLAYKTKHPGAMVECRADMAERKRETDMLRWLIGKFVDKMATDESVAA